MKTLILIMFSLLLACCSKQSPTTPLTSITSQETVAYLDTIFNATIDTMAFNLPPNSVVSVNVSEYSTSFTGKTDLWTDIEYVYDYAENWVYFWPKKTIPWKIKISIIYKLK
jgi:hypothetical protein